MKSYAMLLWMSEWGYIGVTAKELREAGLEEPLFKRPAKNAAILNDIVGHFICGGGK